MATAEQIKALIRSHWSEDSERFLTTALQVAAHEARQGHGELAHELRAIIDHARREAKARAPVAANELDGMLLRSAGDTPLAALVVPPALHDRIRRVLHEYHQRDKLRHHGLAHRRKLLLVGPPGTGKTMTANVLAHELRLPLRTVQVDRMVTRYMGETGAKLRQVFDVIRSEEGVYFFDEFDALGGGRARENDVGEMRRVLNSLLQFIENDTSDSLIVAATNSPELLDAALFRRFDDVLEYELPGPEERRRLIGNVLGTFLPDPFPWKTMLTASASSSGADIAAACRDAAKEAILADQTFVDPAKLKRALAERRAREPRA